MATRPISWGNAILVSWHRMSPRICDASPGATESRRDQPPGTPSARVYSVGVWVAIAIAAAFLLGVADYLFRFQDPGVRYLCSRACWRCWVGAASVPVSGVAISPQRSPGRAADRRPVPAVAGAVVQQPSSSLAKRTAIRWRVRPDLRRAVIAGDRRARSSGWISDACLDARRPQRSALLAGVICLVVAAVCCLGRAGRLAGSPAAGPALERGRRGRGGTHWNSSSSRRGSPSGPISRSNCRPGTGRLPDVVKMYYWFDGDGAAQRPGGHHEVLRRQAGASPGERAAAVPVPRGGRRRERMPWTARWRSSKPPHVES